MSIITATSGCMSRPPRRLPNHSAMCAINVIAAAIVAAIDEMRMSLCWTWASSCAIRPANSSGERNLRIPSVAATVAWVGLRPVANALGVSDGMIQTVERGSPARWARPATGGRSGSDPKCKPAAVAKGIPVSEPTGMPVLRILRMDWNPGLLTVGMKHREFVCDVHHSASQSEVVSPL
jgi:hypothetical protein